MRNKMKSKNKKKNQSLSLNLSNKISSRNKTTMNSRCRHRKTTNTSQLTNSVTKWASNTYKWQRQNVKPSKKVNKQRNCKVKHSQLKIYRHLKNFHLTPHHPYLTRTLRLLPTNLRARSSIEITCMKCQKLTKLSISLILVASKAS